MNREIPIFFTIDEGYAPYLATARASAIHHASPARRYRAIILHQDLAEETIRRLQALETENFKLQFEPMQTNLEALDDRMENRLRCDYFTLTIYYRLFIPAMFPQYDKGIYVDSDLVFTADPAELFDTDIGDKLVGACRDLSIIDVPPLVAYTQDAVGIPAGDYVNSGVLLMNLAALREAALETHFLRLLTTWHFDCIAPDQDYLNAMCCGRIFFLDPAWDAMPNPNREPMENPKLVHYNLFSKPWCYDGIPYGDLFWEYAAKSGFMEEILAHKRGYTPEKMQADAACLSLLVRRGSEIPQGEITFRKLFEKGEAIRL